MQATRYSVAFALIATVQRHPELDGRRISLRPARATPIKDILPVLIRGTSLSVITEPFVNQTFFGELKNLTILKTDLVILLTPTLVSPSGTR